MFRTCDNKGFQIKFSNGYMVSCQFGTMNYCERRSFEQDKIFSERKERIVQSEDCEVAIIDTRFSGIDTRHFVTAEILEQAGLEISNDGMVAGWVSADDVAKIVAYVSGLEG